MEDIDPDPYLDYLNFLISITDSFTPGIILGIIIVLLLFIVSALISGSEIAFFSLTPSQMQSIKTNESTENKLVIRLLESPKQLLATILITNNLVNVSIVILSAYILRGFLNLSSNPVLGFVLEVIVITALILLFGEIMPKIYATQKPEEFASFMARPLHFLAKLLRPFSGILVSSTSIIDKRIAKKSQSITMSDLSEAIEITADESIPEEETKILKGIVKFADIEVSEIMKSRVDVTAIDSVSTFKELVQTVVSSGYSRIPVYEETFDKIVGILYVKDLLPFLGEEKEFDWQQLLHQAFFVPENKKISDLLKEFQEKKIHLAIVVDEYGGTSGIVTLEDIIEEIIGEISDEYDMPGDDVVYKKISDSNYIFEGKTSLNDFCKIVAVGDKIFDEVKGEFDTMAGLLLEIQGEIPALNTTVTFNKFEFKIIQVDDRRIKRIQVKINNTEEE
ncbi:MAG: gliding motility-associated protein GldE [Bacteroidales bacterium]|nr:gliding motility-associated protein GldE [Bacteroidales bacterium]